MKEKVEYIFAGLVLVIAALCLIPLVNRNRPPARPVVVKVEPPKSGGEITIAFAGDTMLAEDAQAKLDSTRYRVRLSELASLMQSMSLMVVNLEGVVTSCTQPVSESKPVLLRMRPEALDALAWAGVDAVTLANNHTLDYCVEGFADCLERLQKTGVDVVGGGMNESEARRALIFDFGSVRVGLLNYMEGYEDYVKRYKFFAGRDTPGIALLDERNLRTDITSLRKEVDVLLVVLHWGAEYKGVNKRQERFGRLAIDLGADAVLGHHTHDFQEIEIYRGKPIFYSLGNLVFDSPAVRDLDYGMVAKLVIKERKINRVDVIPIVTQKRIIQQVPRPAVGKEADNFFSKLVPLSTVRHAIISRNAECGTINLNRSDTP